MQSQQKQTAWWTWKTHRLPSLFFLAEIINDSSIKTNWGQVMTRRKRKKRRNPVSSKLGTGRSGLAWTHISWVTLGFVPSCLWVSSVFSLVRWKYWVKNQSQALVQNLGMVFVSWGSRDKEPRPGGLRRTEMYALPVWRLWSRIERLVGVPPPEAPGNDPSAPPPVSRGGHPAFPLLRLHLHLSISASVFSCLLAWVLLCSKFPPLIGTPVVLSYSPSHLSMTSS